MGAIDLDAVHGDIQLRYGKSGESADLLGMDEPVKVEPRQVVYADDAQIITWLWNHRDAKATAVNESSKNVVFFADSLLGTELAEKAIVQLSAALDALGVEIITQGVVG
jgi:DNA/RNA-binding domain of Phe-tRNA-synthetase-like protein